MTTATLIERLAALPSELRQAEEAALIAAEMAQRAKQTQQDTEDYILTEGLLTGKNEAIRSAQLRELTAAQTRGIDLIDIECRQRKAAMQVRCLRDELASLRSIAKLLAGEEMER